MKEIKKRGEAGVYSGPSIKINPKRLALVSRDYKRRSADGKSDFSPYLQMIINYCEEKKIDTILYSLWGYNVSGSQKISKNKLFATTKNIKNIIIETYKVEAQDKFCPVSAHVFNKHESQPARYEQIFGMSADKVKLKKKFVNEFGFRIHGESAIVLCGETNIIKIKRVGDNPFEDNFGILPKLDSNGIKYIFNPIHDYMTRYEMKEKRKVFSENKRYVFSVWNQGKRKGESKTPWTVFYDGEDKTHEVEEISPSIIDERLDIRVGFFNIK